MTATFLCNQSSQAPASLPSDGQDAAFRNDPASEATLRLKCVQTGAECQFENHEDCCCKVESTACEELVLLLCLVPLIFAGALLVCLIFDADQGIVGAAAVSAILLGVFKCVRSLNNKGRH